MSRDAQPPCQSSKPLSAFTGVDVPNDDLITNCMQCGFCLQACPTYAQTGLERNSPRGRIRLIKAVAHGELAMTETFQQEMYYCLSCRACETACPAGVQYGALVEAARAQIFQTSGGKGHFSALGRVMLRHVLPYRHRLRWLARLLWASQRLGLPQLGLRSGLLGLLAPKLARMMPLQPRIDTRFAHQRLPETLPAQGARRTRVGLLLGCVMDVAFAGIDEDTAYVLARNGCEVVSPKRQECCGSLNGHLGDMPTARRLARQLIDIFEAAKVDLIAVNAAGCGSFIKEYGHLLHDDPDYAERAARFTAKVRDVSELLDELPWTPPTRAPQALVAYHDACHLAHGQQITAQPRRLLDAIPGLQRVELPEADWCCGSAGVYNITHDTSADYLLRRKLAHVRKCGARILLAANPGCLMQLQHGAAREGLELEILHPISLLARCYRMQDRQALTN